MAPPSYFEYHYHAGFETKAEVKGPAEKTLVVCMASRSAIRHAADETVSKKTEFFQTLSSINVDALFIRPAYTNRRMK